MKEVLRIDNPAEVAVLKSVFEAAGIPLFVFDEHTSSIMGGLGGWTPCRLMVPDSEEEDALRLIEEFYHQTEAGGKHDGSD